MRASMFDAIGSIFGSDGTTLHQEVVAAFADPANGEMDYVVVQRVCGEAPTPTLVPIEINCRSAMLSDARDQADMAPLPTFPVPWRMWLHDASTRESLVLLPTEAELAAICNKTLLVTAIIKRNNKKKHDSHRMFFEGMLPVHKDLYGREPPFLFCSDVGTLYGPKMIHDLVAYLQKPGHESVAACCAHQRIMTYADQAAPTDSAKEGAFAAMLRDVQGFDFESGLAIFNGMHAILGFLPVIPGPCGMFRTAHITNSVLEDVRVLCENPADRDSLIQVRSRCGHHADAPCHVAVYTRKLATELSCARSHTPFVVNSHVCRAT